MLYFGGDTMRQDIISLIDAICEIDGKKQHIIYAFLKGIYDAIK